MPREKKAAKKNKECSVTINTDRVVRSALRKAVEKEIKVKTQTYINQRAAKLASEMLKEMKPKIDADLKQMMKDKLEEDYEQILDSIASKMKFAAKIKTTYGGFTYVT